ncbi:hypothetical protein L596_004738 [Steinernema carpocapsae]|uniref:Uncharacterized protein n=1 Tax=Steinernema carpocapsae TaxID=34508 RepID=A0A4U8UWQ7_STECR|nr:hypothetical protein L596_004738 [Steinernema carpocapsae]
MCFLSSSHCTRVKHGYIRLRSLFTYSESQFPDLVSSLKSATTVVRSGVKLAVQQRLFRCGKNRAVVNSRWHKGAAMTGATDTRTPHVAFLHILAVKGRGGNIFCLDQQNGHLLWRSPCGGRRLIIVIKTSVLMRLHRWETSFAALQRDTTEWLV